MSALVRVAAILALALAGCRVCTLIGCEDAMTLDVFSPDGGRVTSYQGTITLDGTPHPFTCPAPDEVWQQYRCGANSQLYISLSFIGRGGTSRLIGDTPPQVLPLEVQAEDGGLAASRMLMPAYTANQPNGPGCGPTCYFHRESLTLEAR